MVLPAFVIDQSTHETIATFGIEVDVPLGAEVPWVPERWALVRSYRLPATGPGEHPWFDWIGAVLLLGTVAGVLGRAL